MESGLSGAGESIPAAAQEASRPGICSSSNATRIFCCAKRKAMAPPMIPPPTTTVSYELMRFILAGNLGAYYTRRL